MEYTKIKEGRFVARPNRFIAHVEVEGKEEVCHVKNTGRCKELLLPGAAVFVQQADAPSRKTKYDLIAVYKGETLVNIDSQAPNPVFGEWLAQGHLFGKDAIIRREVSFGRSRFDFYVEDGARKAFIEVKGVTLEQDGMALFPDAPTLRGVKHLTELCQCVQQGYEAYVVFVVQMKGPTAVAPNDATHEAFGAALRHAKCQGVNILALDCVVTNHSIQLDASLPILL